MALFSQDDEAAVSHDPVGPGGPLLRDGDVGGRRLQGLRAAQLVQLR